MQRFHIEDTAMILIDHQVGTNKWARTTPLDLLQRNVIILATFAKGTGMPVVLTSSQETNVNVQVACDACGSTNQIAEEMAWRRMERAGVRLTSTIAIVAELVHNWASPAGAVAFPLVT
jgi:hypothetical protein